MVKVQLSKFDMKPVFEEFKNALKDELESRPESIEFVYRTTKIPIIGIMEAQVSDGVLEQMSNSDQVRSLVHNVMARFLVNYTDEEIREFTTRLVRSVDTSESLAYFGGDVRDRVYSVTKTVTDMVREPMQQSFMDRVWRRVATQPNPRDVAVEMVINNRHILFVLLVFFTSPSYINPSQTAE